MRITFILFIQFIFIQVQAQLTGKVTDSEGAPLAYASIYVQNTTIGTTSNPDGVYTLELKPGTYEIVYQYIGYKQKVLKVEVAKGKTRQDVVLEIETVKLSEIVVSADAEDPAYAIIRKAIKKRPYYKKLVDSYQCDVYIKGTQKLLDAPEKILGQEIGNMGGILDSNRQGIVYLSESVSKLYYQKPDQKKEEMISSKVSGDDNGFSFNQASLMDFDFYENHIEIGRNIMSPIANNALNYYRYKLLGTIFDEEGRLINKIQVIPKRNEDAVFSGLIYIVEDLWNIQATELVITGATVKQPILDSLIIRQVHVPVKAPDTWMQLSQTLDFKLGVFGFEFVGNFTGVFSNYKLDVDFTDKFFNNEIFKVEEGANEKEISYWDSIRPIPLTVEESIDYIKKDSLQLIWESKEFLDSIDHKSNKFKVWDLLFGYQYSNSYEKASFSISSPVTTLQFNPVQGYYGNVDIVYRKFFDEESARWLRINPKVQYGLADKRLRADLQTGFQFNAINFSRLELSGGTTTAQFNSREPITPFLNTLYCLMGHRNYIKIYDKAYGKIAYRKELVNGFFLLSKLEYAKRSPLSNNSNHSLYKKDKIYDPNDPLYPKEEGLDFLQHETFELGLSLRYRIGQKYLSYPGRKFIIASRYPDLWIHYRKGIAAFGSDTDYDFIKINIRDEISMGLVGRSEFNLEAGLFLNDRKIQFMDFQHFNGNQTFIYNPDRFLSSFLMLPYYEYSTTRPYFQGHIQHHFEGFLIDKMPLLRKLNLKTVFGVSFLYTDEKKDYLELSYGFDNLGFGFLRIFRVDGVVSFKQGKYQDWGIRLGVDL